MSAPFDLAQTVLQSSQDPAQTGEEAGRPMSIQLELVEPDSAPPVWAALRNQAEAAARAEPALYSMLNSVILQHDRLADALSYQLAV
ncbi:MAG: serine O-acetyltransferase, partial [Caulobacteraceae bacterium]